MQLPEPALEGALRIGLGKFTTETDIAQAAALITEAVSEISRLL
jgi:cysteine desulfurase